MRVVVRTLACAAVLALAGCGGGNVVVKGRIVVDGADLALAPNEAVLMTLSPADGNPAASPFSGSVSPDGSFVVSGPSDGSGVPPGKYKVSLQTLLTDRERSQDRFGGQYATGKSSLEIEVTRRMAPVELRVTSAR
jgi:hypothetical protein